MIKHAWRVALLLVATSGVHAQPVSDPALLQAYAAIRAMGPNLNPQVIEQTGKLYAEIHKTTDKGNLDVTRDVKYGADAKNAMDIYRPAQASGGPRPAV